MKFIVHGGAGNITDFAIRVPGLVKACKIGYEILKSGGKALDAVQASVVEFENNPYFNAGTGCVLNIEGEAELDASIMTDDMKAGAVAGIKRVKNPILIARKVMEETDHILLVGEGAERFARIMGFPKYNPVTAKSKERLEKDIKKLKMGKNTTERYFPKIKKLIDEYGTVGACAMDKFGNLAAATSTGGVIMDLPGRVGDTPIIGAGTYACKTGAVSCTGWGECLIKLGTAKFVCDSMKTMSPQAAVNKAIKLIGDMKGDAGIIALDKKGRIGFGFNTPKMLWAYVDENGKIQHCK
ncbi:MAG: isoaspartyl peptidase/L-asparaginase [bacterium]